MNRSERYPTYNVRTTQQARRPGERHGLVDTMVSVESTGRSVLLEHKRRLEGGQRPAASGRWAQGHPEE